MTKTKWLLLKKKKELADTDYLALKFMEGWLTEEEYAPIKTQRQILRREVNELQAQVNNEETEGGENEAVPSV